MPHDAETVEAATPTAWNTAVQRERWKRLLRAARVHTTPCLGARSRQLRSPPRSQLVEGPLLESCSKPREMIATHVRASVTAPRQA